MGFIDLENDLTSVLPGVEVPPAVANFIFERIHWIQEGEVGEFELEPPVGWSLCDLFKLAFFVVNNESQLAKDVIESVAPSAMTMLTSSTLLQGEHSNDNYLKKSPFRRRKSKKLRRDTFSVEKQGSDGVMAVGVEQNTQVGGLERRYSIA